MQKNNDSNHNYSADDVLAVANNCRVIAHEMMKNVFFGCLGGYFLYIFWTDAKGETGNMHSLMFNFLCALIITHALAAGYLVYSCFLFREAQRRREK